MANDSTSTPEGTPPVSCSIEGDIGVVRIDDGKANALSHEVLGGIESALDRVEQEAKVLLLLGREGRFSAGFDLSVMTGGPEGARDLLGRGARLALRLYEFPIPVVFGVSGHALAMGGILLCCADVRVGARGDFKLGLPEVRIGMPVPGFAIGLCRDRLSPRWFTRSIQLGESLSPEDALDAGFLDELVELSEVDDRAREVAAELVEAIDAGPFRTTRGAVRSALAQELREALDTDLAWFSVTPS